MMKTLYLLRHAKSSWDDQNLADFDRPLNERGLSAAPFMGETLAQRGLIPEEIVSSPAKRAIQTAMLVKESGGFGAQTRLEERIYEASPQTLLQVSRAISDEFVSAMIVGHNPGMEGFIALLTGSLERMPTAAVAVIETDVEKWSELEPGSARLICVLRPNELR
jgi:phosphohistidine phosphatase